MPDLIPGPNIELLARDYLVTFDQITELVDAAHIVSVLPEGVPAKGVPAVRVTRIGGGMVQDRPHWAHQPRVQCEAWSTIKNEAHTIAALCHAAFAEAHLHHHDLGVVAGVRTVLGLQDIPDQSFPGPMHRWTFDTRWTVHPHPQPLT